MCYLEGQGLDRALEARDVKMSPALTARPRAKLEARIRMVASQQCLRARALARPVGHGGLDLRPDKRAEDAASQSKGKGKAFRKGSDSGPSGQQQGSDWQQVRWVAKASAVGADRLVQCLGELEDALEQKCRVAAQLPLEDLVVAASMMSDAMPGSVIIYTGEACQQLDEVQRKWPVARRHMPGSIGKQTRLREVWVVSVVSFGQGGDSAAELAPAMSFVRATAPAKRQRQDSVVMRVSVHKSFADDKGFAQMLRKPGPTFRAWWSRTSPLAIGELLDTWRWESIEDRVQGMARLTKPAARQLLQASGYESGGITVFCTPVAWSDFDIEAPSLLWVSKTDRAEYSSDYCCRVRKDSVEHGLHCQGGRLVRLDALDPRIQPRSSLWDLHGADASWICQDITELLVSAGFEEPTVMARMLRKGKHVWQIKATRPDFRDFIPIVIDDEGVEKVLEVTKVVRRQSPGRATTLPTERVSKFGPVPIEHLIAPARPKSKAKANGHASAAQPAHDNAVQDPFEGLLGMELDADCTDTHVEVGQKRSAPDQVVEQAPAKCTRVIELSSSAKVCANPGQGNCVFHCLADAVGAKRKAKIGHRQLRSGLVRWMEEHRALLEPAWDKLGPTGVAMNSFSEYLDALSTTGAWAGFLELHSAAIAEDLNILVCGPSGLFKFPCRSEGGTPLALRLQSDHFERVELPEPEFVSLWMEAQLGKPEGHRAGGPGAPPAEDFRPGLFLSEGSATSSVSAGPSGVIRKGLCLSEVSATVQVRKGLLLCAGESAAGSGLDPGFPVKPPCPPAGPGQVPVPSVLGGGGADVSSAQSVAAMSSTGWAPSRAELRTLRRRIHGKSKPWMSLKSLAGRSEGPEINHDDLQDEDLEGDAKVEPEPKLPKTSFKLVNGLYTLPCPHCAFMCVHKSFRGLPKVRWAHMERCHPELQSRVLGRPPIIPELVDVCQHDPSELGWRCPVPGCTKAFLKGDFTAEVVTKAHNAHWKAAHKRAYTKKKWNTLLITAALTRPDVRKRRSVTSLNAGLAGNRNLRQLTERGFKAIPWPSLRKRVGRPLKLSVLRLWFCGSCGVCLSNSARALKHRCGSGPTLAFMKARRAVLQKAQDWCADTTSHGRSQQDLDALFGPCWDMLDAVQARCAA
eukprot:s6446_g2.t1